MGGRVDPGGTLGPLEAYAPIASWKLTPLSNQLIFVEDLGESVDNIFRFIVEVPTPSRLDGNVRIRLGGSNFRQA